MGIELGFSSLGTITLVALWAGDPRVIAAHDLVRRLAGAIAVPVISAEGGAPIARRATFAGLVAHLRGGLGRPGNEKLAALRAMDVFAGVSTSELRRLSAQLDVAEVGPGHVLTPEGRRNDALWLLLEGTAARSIRGREVGQLGPQSLVGAPSMIYDQPAIATVTALTSVRALVVGKAQFQAIGAIDSVILRLKAATADRLREYLRVDRSASAPGAALGVRIAH